ncbi:MAG: DUF2161 family putative PD-(D/E)XK-type phosphodiesterase, partial [Pseudomonadota bacterium]
MPVESDLYAPVKAFLEGQSYEVKGEVGAADVVAVRGAEPPVIVELKTSFSLTLLHQAVERQAVTDSVYIAVPRGSGKPFRAALKRNMTLCRRLGLGLITIRQKDGFVEAHLDPGPYKPRISKVKGQRLLREFTRRVGDPMAGGSSKTRPMITAYRQDALRCAVCLHQNGPTKASIVAKLSEVERARPIMSADHYGWF